MRALSLFHSKNLFVISNNKLYLNQINRFFSSVNYSNNNNNLKKEKNSLIKANPATVLYINPVKINAEKNLFLKFYSTSSESQSNSNQKESEAKSEEPKKKSKFKQFYSQYGPMFLVVHLTTVVMWIYGFYLISKQGYDLTQLLNLFHYLNLMAKETVDSIHHKIDNYKMESGWVTGQNLKHFATAYMIYKVIAPFRYMVSIAIVRFIVKNLRAKGLMKS